MCEGREGGAEILKKRRRRKKNMQERYDFKEYSRDLSLFKDAALRLEERFIKRMKWIMFYGKAEIQKAHYRCRKFDV